MFTKTLLSAILFVGLFLSHPSPTSAQQPGQSYKEMETEILKYVNEHRKGMGLKPLRMNGMITSSAEKHTRNMATKKVPFGHDGFNDRMEGLYKQLKPVYAFAENVAFGAKNAKDVVDQWLNSPEHKKNIEGPDYNLTGFGVAQGADGVLYFTEIFIYKGN